MASGWRQNLADVISAIRGTLADAALAGSMSAADFLKLAGLPSSAVPTTRSVGTTAPLTGGGDLSADRTLAISPATAIAAGSMAAADFAKLAGLPSTAPPTSRLIGTTAPLTGGGDLSADRTFAISPATSLAEGSLAAVDFAKLASVPTGTTIALAIVGDEMDLVGGTGTFYTVIPPCPFKLLRLTSINGWITQVGGTRSVVGSVQAGTNSTADNWATSGSEAAGILTQAADTLVVFGGGTQIAPVPTNLDMTTNGFRIKVVSGITGTTPVCKVRCLVVAQVLAI